MTASEKPIRPVCEACASVCVCASKLRGASPQFSPQYRLTDFPAPRTPHFTCARDSQPFRSLANSFPGANRPMGPWPIRSLAHSLPGPLAPWSICSLAISLPGTFAPRSEMAGPFAPRNESFANFRSRNFPSVNPEHYYAICDLQPLDGSAAAAYRTYLTGF